MTLTTLGKLACIFPLTAVLAGQLSAQSDPDHKPPLHHNYRLVDLGTFGGAQGAVNPQGNGGPYLNDRGWIVGYSQTSTPIPPGSNGFLCSPGPGINHAFVWREAQTVDLGAITPSDYNCSNALAVSDRGEIAGQSSNGLIDPLLGLIELRAVVWKDGVIHDLGTFGGNESGAGSINRSGQVAGYALNSIPDPYSIFGNFFSGSQKSTQTRAFLWENGHKRDLGTLGGPDAEVYPGGSINDRGQISGFSYTNAVPNLTTQLPTIHPFLWDGHKMIDLGSLGGNLGFATGLNNQGEVTGPSFVKGDASSHPYLWSHGAMRDLGTFGGTQGEGNAINDRGEVAGDAYFPGDTIRHGFLWKDGKMKDLGVLPGDKCSAAWVINNQEQVVGSSGMCGFGIRAFLWEKGEIVNVNDLISPKSSVVLVDPTGINDRGEIGINGLPHGCDDLDVCGHPYLLIPEGECDDASSAKITASQPDPAELAPGAVVPKSTMADMKTARTFVASFMKEMRHRYHIPEPAASVLH